MYMAMEILTIEDVAKMLKVSERTVYDWASKGEIPGGKLGTSWRFDRREVEHWVSSKISPRIRHSKPGQLKLLDIVTPARIVFTDVRKKSAVLAMLADTIAAISGAPQRSLLIDAVQTREHLMSTGIGMGIAVPHVRLHDVADLHAAMALCRHGIDDYESIDGLPVTIIIMIAAGWNQHTQYIQVLSNISSILRRESVRRAVLNAPDAERIYDILAEER